MAKNAGEDKRDKRGKQVKEQEERSILINFVLDTSGSMDVIRDATISGFNEFLGDQRPEGGDARMTLTLFDSVSRTVATAVPVREMRDLDHHTYRPDGMTALFDAIGHTLRLTDDYVAAHGPDQVLFVIMTDGHENASREFNGSRILDMIEKRKRDAGYEFIYLGANQDSMRAAESIGIRGGKSMDWAADPLQAKIAMERASRNVKAYRRDGSRQMDENSFFCPQFEESGDLSYEEHRRQKDSGKR
ncbi:MAG: vWA domain-containing protein [Coriobacteriia bacterium]|nr:vWA domain-containing protein [Coriobacteriia bacterium]